MAYEVLARRWRPQLFADVVGQEHVTRTIKNALKQGRLAHAFLFTGPRGCGKTSTARILARAVNCPNVDLQGDPEPCNECETCKALMQDRELDVIEMDAASYRGIEDVRRINDTCRLAPVAGRKKVYIIDEVHMFTKEAFNALLKTLEEPPEHVIFILATTDVHKVPATILSRVQRFDFRPVQPIDVAPHLVKICEKEGWPADPEALWLIARRGEGSLRDAEGLLDQVVSYADQRVTLEATRDVLGLMPGELFAQATRLINDRNISDVPAFLEQLAQRGTDYGEFLKALQTYWMDLLFLNEGLTVASRSAEEIAQMQAAATELGVEDLFRLIRLAETLEDGIKWSTAPRVRFEISFLRWVTLDRLVAIRDLLMHMDRGGKSPIPVTLSDTPTPAPSPAPERAEPLPLVAPPVSGSTTTTAPGEISLEQIRQAWPDILRALRKRSAMVAVAAEKFWTVESLNGKKLTVSCTSPEKFVHDQMKANLPHLAAAITEVCSAAFTVIAGPPRVVSAESPAEPAAPTVTPPPPGDDLFASFMSRFGGVEIDPNKNRDPK
jgi:DNA polymerase III subunit gamma/tau